MISSYFRQAWQLLQQNKLFSAIYIGGTALAIATTTIFAVIYYVKLAPIYPEVNRDRTAYVSRVRVSGNSWQAEGSVGPDLLRQTAALPGVERVSAVRDMRWSDNYVGLPGERCDISAVVKAVDPAFFDIYEFDFKSGHRFSDADFESGVRSAVISDGLARQVFGSDGDVTGRELSYNYDTYRVAGVVREGSALVPMSYATLYVPYTSLENYDSQSIPFMGGYQLVLVTDSLDKVRDGVGGMVRRHNAQEGSETVELWEQPVSHAMSVFVPSASSTGNLGKAIRGQMMILLVLLLVPALNLSGMISGRMETRGSELGVRRSFGATRRHLMWQVVWENLALTLLGGIVGLALTWMLLWLSHGSLLTLADDRWAGVAAPTSVTPEMLFAPAVFGIMLALSVVLNMMSALIPAWITSRRQIVKSLKTM